MCVLERLDFTVALPKLNVVTVNELLGVLLRDFIVRADQFDCPEKPTIGPNNVRSIPDHLRSLLWKNDPIIPFYPEWFPTCN
jgi:hypothetical protein